jgi:hypothetical protein
MIARQKMVRILAQVRRKKTTIQMTGKKSQPVHAKNQAACSTRSNILSGYLDYKGTARRAFFVEFFDE